MFKKKKKILGDLIPKHVAFIMDGNGRWAKKRGLPRLVGHNSGMESLKKIIKASKKIGIEYVTFYAFSTENWKRPKEEIKGLMDIIVKFVRSEIDEIHANNVKINIIGEYSAIPSYAKEAVDYAINQTKDNDGMCVTIALNYGGRDEIVRATQKMLSWCLENNYTEKEITPEIFARFLDTSGIPDPDLLIRTSQEQRLSNFMLWQLAYTEFIFHSTYWPDFNEAALEEAIIEYQSRNRRFGGL